MTTDIKDYRDLIPVIVEREGVTMPDWCDSWGIKSVCYDLRTRNGYQWPTPGNVAECDPDRIFYVNRGACPLRDGDGLCIAGDWECMASGGFPAHTLLLIAYAQNDVLGFEWGDPPSGKKCRVKRAYVAAIVDGARLLIDDGYMANLKYANLRNADLTEAHLANADLTGANLHMANLHRANLSGARLSSAYLAQSLLSGSRMLGADMVFADLTMAAMNQADMNKVNLSRASLKMASLVNAMLIESNLRGACLQGADLSYANLTDADLREANLVDAKLSFTIASSGTALPVGYTVERGYIVREKG